MNYLLSIAELVGTVAFAISGATLAIQKRLDLFGILFLGLVTALGGGTIRDLLLGYNPPKMFYKTQFVELALVSALMVYFLANKKIGRYLFRGADDFLFNLIDALGLGIFAVIGTQAGITAGFRSYPFFCIFLGMTTGVGGGVLRDVMCGDIPFVLRKHIYAVAAIFGSVVFYTLSCLGIDVTFASLLGMVSTVVLRLLARH